MNINEWLLPYNDKLIKRSTSDLDMIVLHCTELPTMTLAREFGEKVQAPEKGTGFSGHYYIDKDGSVYRYVTDDRVAHHVIGHNEKSIGIELVNIGRYPHWYSSKNQTCSDPYPLPQLESLRELLRSLHEQYANLVKIARHSDLDTTCLAAEDDPAVQIRRKIDPGPMFPWKHVEAFWYSL